MTSERQWLVDKSAYVRLGDSGDAELWAERISRGLVLVTTVTRLEIGYSTTSGKDWSRVFDGAPLSELPVVHLTPRMEERAVEVQGILARRGRHRAPSIPDLLVAAAAELSGVTVLHVDKDFTIVAEVTGQDLERLRVA